MNDRKAITHSESVSTTSFPMQSIFLRNPQQIP
jgi:hypothetical protein